MTLIYDNQEIFGKIVNQGIRRLSGFGKIQMPRIVLDTGTDPRLPNHLYIKVRSFRNSLGFEIFFFFFEVLHALIEFGKNILAGETQLIHGNDIRTCREDHAVLQLLGCFSAKDINQLNFLDFIPEEDDTYSLLSFGSGEDIYRVSFDTKTAPSKVAIVSTVLNFDEIAKECIPVAGLPGTKRNSHIEVFRRCT